MRWLLPLFLMISISAPAADEVIAETAAETVVSSTPVVAAVPAAIDTRKESEIPLNLDGNKKATTEGSGAFRIILSLGMLGILGVGAFVFLRKYQVPKSSKHQTQIKILQQHFLGPKKSLAIVHVAGESILVGITDHNISLIKSLSLIDDEVPAETNPNFNKVLKGLGTDTQFASDTDENANENESPKARKAARALDTEEEFAISGIKDIVSKRLKGMRSL